MTRFVSPTFAASLPPLADADRFASTQPPGSIPPGNIDDLLADASAAIRRYCGWHISPVIAEDVVLDGSGSTSQRLPSLRVVEIVAVTNAGQELDVSKLEWSTDGFMRLGMPGRHYGYGGGSAYGYGYGGGWTSHLRGVEVSYRHGFDPADVGQLAALTCTLVARSIASPRGYLTGESVGSVSLSYGGTADDRPSSMSLLGYEQQLLDNYRLPGRRSG